MRGVQSAYQPHSLFQHAAAELDCRIKSKAPVCLVRFGPLDAQILLRLAAYCNRPVTTRGLLETMRMQRTKVNGQWSLFRLVYHIEKLSHAGNAAYATRGELPRSRGRCLERAQRSALRSLNVQSIECALLLRSERPPPAVRQRFSYDGTITKVDVMRLHQGPFRSHCSARSVSSNPGEEACTHQVRTQGALNASA